LQARSHAGVVGQFKSISYNEAIMNCIGIIDGYLLRIKTPSRIHVGNVKSYFSGHYQCYGINIQAVGCRPLLVLYLLVSRWPRHHGWATEMLHASKLIYI
jgi:hypothetical protein